ncbi:Fibrobacter succinogenes major domain (Fib_succ_major) [Elizabethkingia miricola]|nr:Fibrobacter succinogenes major domain (Fib_succ_major) [Elizabethkingia miricola]
MKKKLYSITGITLLSVLFFNSCRSTDTDNNITNGIASVNFNLLGTEFSDSSPALNASLNKNTISVPGVQTHSVLVNPSTVITAALTPFTDPTLAKVSDIKPMAAVSGTLLTTGMKFRVIAYRQSNGNYHTHQDYTVGQPATPVMLDNSAGYNIVVYSYGTASLPAISSGEQDNISNASVNYDDANRDFMYQKISYTPVNDNNTLNITLRHKVAQTTTIVKNSTRQWAGNIYSIKDAIISPHYSDGIFSLNTGSMSGRSLSTNAAITFPAPNATSVTAAPVFVNADTNGNLTGTFSAKIATGSGPIVDVLAYNAFKITPGNKSNLTINLRTCYAKFTTILSYDIMCHNLGADQSADPFTPAAAIHGAKYQWGAQTDEAGRYYSQSDDQSNSGVILGWNTSGKSDGAWSESNKTVNDPCPTGYHVPKPAEWQAIIDNNAMTYIGSNWTSSPTNYNNGIKIGNDLFLPIAGYRQSLNGGELGGRGFSGEYWSSGILGVRGASLLITNGSMVGATATRTLGLSIRCFADHN